MKAGRQCWWAAIVVALAWGAGAPAAPGTVQAAEQALGEAPAPWPAGPYSYSDELGGFRITDISGIGTREDPVVLRQILVSVHPVTLVIRAIRPIRPLHRGSEFATGIIYLRLETLNASGLAWIEMEFELQSEFGVPSGFGDGLSFDQRQMDAFFVSDRFGQAVHQHEPHDRVLFTDGYLDPDDTARFSLLLTDYTPKPTFYLVQDPRIPAS